MGSSHVRTLATAVNSATVTAVADVDLERARAAAREAGAAGVSADGRWLLGQEIVAATVVAGRATRYAPADVRDPLLVLLETDGGVLIDVESFVRARYGYDIRCEIVGEEGTLFLAPATETAVAEGFEVR